MVNMPIFPVSRHGAYELADVGPILFPEKGLSRVTQTSFQNMGGRSEARRL
jgi:hypothetical protein